MEKISLEIGTNGELVLEVEGVKGKACTDLTKTLEKALGKTTQDIKTREYSERARATEKVQANG